MDKHNKRQQAKTIFESFDKVSEAITQLNTALAHEIRRTINQLKKKLGFSREK